MSDADFTKRIGNDSTFAVEFELSQSFPSKWNEWRGRIWLWVGGQLVGNPAETEIVSIALDSLMETARETGSRPSSRIPVQSPKELLEVVMWARYGEGGTICPRLIGSEERLYPFEVLPRRTGPSFDNWEAVLVEQGDTERFIFRKGERNIREVSWPLGTFRDVVSRANLEFQSFTSCLLKEPN